MKENNVLAVTAYRSTGTAVFGSTPYFVLPFPRHWIPIFLEALDGLGWKSGHIPISSFNDLLRMAEPDVIAVSSNALAGGTWLVAHTPPPDDVLLLLLHAWLTGLVDDNDPDLVQKAFDRLAGEVQFNWKPIDFDKTAGVTLSAGGTAEPDAIHLRVLPTLLADRLRKSARLRLQGETIDWRICPAEYGTELISWPPQPGGFSFVLTLSVQTVPFVQEFRLYAHIGMRHWLAEGPIKISRNKDSSVYLQTAAPWLSSSRRAPEHMAVNALCRRGGRIFWRFGIVQAVDGLDLDKSLPPVRTLLRDPQKYLKANPSGVTAAIVYSTQLGSHPMGAGVGPMEVVPLMEWLDKCLSPTFERLPGLVKMTTRKVYKNLPSNGRNCLKRESLKADRLNAILAEKRFDAEIVWLEETTRDVLIAEFVEYLGLNGSGGRSTTARRWKIGNKEVVLHLRQYPKLTRKLASSGRREVAAANRRGQVAGSLGTALYRHTILTVTEIDPPSVFGTPRYDPKDSFRLGAADASRVTQFINRAGEISTEDELKHLVDRARSSWNDGFRQLGLRSTPSHSLGRLVPTGLNTVGVWIINKKGVKGHRAIAWPVAVRVTPGKPIVDCWNPEDGSWIPYPDLLRWLSHRTSSMEDGERRGLDRWQARRSAMERYLRLLLDSLREVPTLLLVHAQNIRQAWPWMSNQNLVRDQIDVGCGPQRTTLYGDSLRIARLRGLSRKEVPQYYAVDPPHGQATGVWLQDADPTGDQRVYLSLLEKAQSMRWNLSVSRMGHFDEEGKYRRPFRGMIARPSLLEIAIASCADSDDALALATLIHQLRDCADYRDALALPLPLHLAMLAEEYLFHPTLDDRTIATKNCKEERLSECR